VDKDLARRNMQFGWAMFGLLIALVAGTFLYASIYLARV